MSRTFFPQPVRQMAFILMIIFLFGSTISILLALVVFIGTYYMNVFLILFLVFLLLALAMSVIEEG